MRHLSFTIFALSLPLSLAACSEPEPGPDVRPTAELSEGDWTFTLKAPVLSGQCAGMDLGDVDGTRFEGQVRTPGPSQVVVELEGARLEGDRGGDNVYVSGVYSDVYDVEDRPDEPHYDDDEDRDEDPDEDRGEDCGTSSDDGGAPPPCSEPYPEDQQQEPVEPHYGLTISLDLTVDDATHMRGLGDFRWFMPDAGLDCVLEADVLARHSSLEPTTHPEEEVVIEEGGSGGENGPGEETYPCDDEEEDCG